MKTKVVPKKLMWDNDIIDTLHKRYIRNIGLVINSEQWFIVNTLEIQDTISLGFNY